jgi:hypothetical protein
MQPRRHEDTKASLLSVRAFVLHVPEPLDQRTVVMIQVWREAVRRSPTRSPDRARRLSGPGQLTELAGQRPVSSSQRGPVTGDGFATRLGHHNRPLDQSPSLNNAFSTNATFAGCSPSRRMKYGNHSRPNGT